jgi:hypothetical protein
MGGSIWLNNTAIESHILGIFFIKGCKGYSAFYKKGCKLYHATQIVNKHISKGRSGLLACTQELIEAGLSDFAQI